MSVSFLKQSTASQSRAIGPFVDDTDFKTAETGLTIANTDIKLVVNGGASANKNSGGGTHRVNGVYGITFDATDTATVGEIEVSVVVSGALPVFHKFFVLEEAVYDMLMGASALGYIANAPVVLADGVSHGGTLGSSTATLALSRLSVVSQSSNTNAVTMTGNGTGHGAAMTSGSGATGNGLTLLAASTNGHGLKSTGTGTGDGAELTAGASGADLDADIAGTLTTVTTLTNAPSDSSGVTTLLSRIGGSITITSGRVNADVTHIATAAVNTSSAQLGVNVVNWGGTATGSALVRGNLIQVGGSATPVTNFVTVFDTDFAANYNTTLDAWNVNATTLNGENVSASATVDFDALASGATAATTYLDAAISSRMATYTQPTGFLAATFPTTVASTTNITAGTITTATNVTTVNGLAANVITAASIAADAIGASELAADAVAEIQSGLSTLTAAGVRTAVGLASANLDTQLAAIDDYIDTEVAAIKTVTDRLDTAMELDGSVYRFTTNALEQAPSGSGASAADIADAVWDEVLSGHLTAGSTGNALNAAGSAGDPWTTTLPGSYTGSQAGFIIGTIRAAQLNILSPHVAEDSSTEIVIGDDYYAADNRNLSFLFGASPSLSGATVTLEIQIDTTAEDSDDNYTSTTGTASGTTSQTVTFDLPGTTTSDLSEGWHAYRVKAVLSNSHTVTLLRGRINLLQRGDDAP